MNTSGTKHGATCENVPHHWLARFLPFLRWLSLLRTTWRGDMVAGITIALLLVPQAMAYAQLAGLPPYYGLLAAGLPAILSALFGWCPQLQTGPVAMTSLLTATVLVGTGIAAPGSSEYIALAATLALMIGVMRLVLGACRLASLACLLPRPVILAFTAAGALIIAASQLGQLLGIPMPSTGHYASDVLSVVRRIPEAHGPTVVLGVGALACLLAFKRWAPHWPGVLLTVVSTAVLSWLMDYETGYGGAVVGVVPSGLPAPALPNLNPGILWQLLPGAGIITMVGFLEVLAVSKSIAARTGDRLNLNQELIGQGLANMGGSFFQAFPVSGSLSRSALSLYAGTRTALSGIVAGMIVLVILLMMTRALSPIPRSVLAALIILAVSSLIDLPAMVRTWRISKADGATVAVTILATLAMAPHIERGVLIGAGFAIVLHLYRMMTPHTVIVSLHPDGTLRDTVRHGLPVDQDILAIRFDGRLIFANAERFEEFVLQARATHPANRVLLLIMEGVNEIDSSGEAVLRRLVEDLRAADLTVAFAKLKGPVEDRLRRSGLYDKIGEAFLFRTPEAAWTALKAKNEHIKSADQNRRKVQSIV